MFWNSSNNFLEVQLFTTRYLGRGYIWEEFLSHLFKYKSSYLPQRWDVEEITKHKFDSDSLPKIKNEWLSGKEIQHLFFFRTAPSMLISFSIEKFPRAKFNTGSIYIADKYIKRQENLTKLLSFITELCLIIHTDYGFIAHTLQEKRQSPILTPAERLPGIYWANFFGRPYIEFFGREKLLATPCADVRQINHDLIMILASKTPYEAEMLESDEIVNHIKEYLNQDAFAGPNFPDKPCAVPKFDFSDLRTTNRIFSSESSQEKLARLKTELEAKGYELLEQDQAKLIFVGEDKSIVLIDQNTGEISVDTTI